MSRVLIISGFTILQVVWLFPASGVWGWLARHNITQIQGSYAVYVALWLCWGLLAWQILSHHTDSIARSSFRRVVVAFPLLLLWDALFSQHPSYPVEEANGLLACWVSAAVAYFCAASIRREIANWYILLVLALEAVFALRSWRWDLRIAGGLSSPNLLYPLMLYGMLSSIIHVVRGQRPRDLFAGAFSFLFALTLGATGNRGGMLAGIIAICWMLYKLIRQFYSRDEVPLDRWRVIILLILLLPLGFGWHHRHELTGITFFSDRSVQGRPILWWLGLRIAWASHGLGCGIANYPNAQEQLNDLSLMVQGSGNMEPKNLFIAMLAIYGMPGLCYILSLITKALQFFRRQSDGWRSDESILLFALLVAGMADTPILIPDRFAPTFLWLQWMMISMSPNPTMMNGCVHTRCRKLQHRAVLIVLIVVLLAGGFIGYTYREAAAYRWQLERLRMQPTTPLSAYPPVLVRLLIEREDRLFWSHSGVDWRGVHRAIRANIRTLQLAQGGSTITQQMVRQTLLDTNFAKSKSLLRKAIEVWLAFWAEQELGKQKILELYLQYAFRLDMPPERVGFEAMARYYFDKPIGQLSPDECAVLVGWLSAPPVKGIDWYRTLALRNATLSALDSDAVSYYVQPIKLKIRCFEEKWRR